MGTTVACSFYPYHWQPSSTIEVVKTTAQDGQRWTSIGWTRHYFEKQKPWWMLLKRSAFLEVVPQFVWNGWTKHGFVSENALFQIYWLVNHHTSCVLWPLKCGYTHVLLKPSYHGFSPEDRAHDDGASQCTASRVQGKTSGGGRGGGWRKFEMGNPLYNGGFSGTIIYKLETIKLLRTTTPGNELITVAN